MDFKSWISQNISSLLTYRLSIKRDKFIVSVWIRHLRVYILENNVSLFFFFFLFQPHYLIKSTMNSAQMHCSWVQQIPLFSHFFIKNGSYGTIHTFKNYFAIVFSVSFFSFCKNKPNVYNFS